MKTNTGREPAFKVWAMWGTLAFSFTIVLYHRFSLAVVMDQLVKDFSIQDAALAGALAGMYAFIYMFMQIPAGFMADLWGTRKTVTSGLLVAALGSFLFSLALSLPLAFAGRFLVGLGVSVIFVSILKFQVTWFKASMFATLTGFIALSGNAGSILGTTPTALLVTATGWRQAFIIISIITFAMAVLVWVLVRDYKEPNNAGNNTTLSSRPHKSQAIFLELNALKKICKNPWTWYLFLSSFGIAGVILAFSGSWSIVYLMQVYEMTRNEAANILMAMIIGKLFGFPLLGLISDRLEQRKKPFIFFYAFHIILWVLLLVWNGGKPPVLGLYALFFMLGFTSGIFILVPTLAKEIHSQEHAGVAISVVNIAPFAGMALLQPFLGFILDLKWDGVTAMEGRLYPLEAYQFLFGTCIVLLLFCFIFVLKLKETNCNNIASLPEVDQ